MAMSWMHAYPYHTYTNISKSWLQGFHPTPNSILLILVCLPSFAFLRRGDLSQKSRNQKKQGHLPLNRMPKFHLISTASSKPCTPLVWPHPPQWPCLNKCRRQAHQSGWSSWSFRTLSLRPLQSKSQIIPAERASKALPNWMGRCQRINILRPAWPATLTSPVYPNFLWDSKQSHYSLGL